MVQKYKIPYVGRQTSRLHRGRLSCVLGGMMARTLPLPCRHPGCPELVQGGGYCPKHRRDDYRRQDAVRGTPSQRGYGWEWQRIRRSILMERPYCERCGAPAVLVHHRDHNPANIDRPNLESLCRACHEREHAGKGKSIRHPK
jgi:5-methylcytosine-specific restriction enzyme A